MSGRLKWGLICVIDNGLFLSLITYCIGINAKVNFESCRISSVASIYKTILSAYWESVAILRNSGKSNNTVRMSCSSDF